MKYYAVAAFPYPNGQLHLGHLGTYLTADFAARYYKLRGYDVLYPMGWHVTGLPIYYIARRLARGDQKIVELFTKVYKLPEERIKEFVDPLKIIEFFKGLMKEDMQLLNLMIDWSREFSTIDPHFTKFIHWQFSKLHEKGYIIKGKYPVAWCPVDQQPIGKGSAERSKGEEADIVEMTIIKFKVELNGEEVVLPAATLRPETVFGATNLWINPRLEYWLTEVNGEKWIVVKECIEKLQDQEKVVKPIKQINVTELIGKTAKLVLPDEVLEVKVAPAEFLEAWKGTGIVMSVPAHDPYDYIAYRQVKDQLGLPAPKKVIDTAIDMEQVTAGISSHDDPRLQQLKEEIYLQELSRPYIYGKFAGLTTQEAREKIKEYLAVHGLADKLYELSELAVCRCGAVLHVKIIDQWFIDYTNPAWKELALQWLEQAKIYPEKRRYSVEQAIKNAGKRPCARRVGIGSPFPFEEGWIIEPLSDSTIYMAYFTIAHLIKQVDPEKLTPIVFDYIFLGKGDADEIAKQTGISKELLENMRKEFLRWYPLDVNFTGADLLTNHSTFYIYHHVAIFPRELWPKALGISGIGKYEGQELHKSKGARPVREYIELYGTDVVRLWYAYSAEYGEDFSYYEHDREFVAKRLAQLKELWEKLPDGEDHSLLGNWIKAEFNELLDKYCKLFEELRFRSVAVLLLCEMYNKLELYLQAASNPGAAKSILRGLLALLWPFVPGFVEQLLGGQPAFPSKFELNKTAPAEVIHAYISRLLEDIRAVLKLAARKSGKTPSKLFIYLASDEKYIALEKLLKGEQTGLPKEEEQRMEKIAKELGLAPGKLFDEKELLAEIADFIKKTTGITEIHVFKYGSDKSIYDPSGKAPAAIPYKPSLWVE
ncbi:MAG: leucine--tRNA ligase [bacterium]|nr:leucine--tRNA ligase [bacterium]